MFASRNLIADMKTSPVDRSLHMLLERVQCSAVAV